MIYCTYWTMISEKYHYKFKHMNVAPLVHLIVFHHILTIS